MQLLSHQETLRQFGCLQQVLLATGCIVYVLKLLAIWLPAISCLKDQRLSHFTMAFQATSCLMVACKSTGNQLPAT